MVFIAIHNIIAAGRTIHKAFHNFSDLVTSRSLQHSRFLRRQATLLSTNGRGALRDDPKVLPLPTRVEITWRKFYKSEALENSFTLPQSGVLVVSCLACEFYKFPSTTGLDLSNMEDTYHRPDQKTLQALKDMANKLRIDSIESTNTAGSGYVQYAVILMLNFAAWFNSQVAFKLPDFIFQTSVFVLFYG